MNHQPLFLEEGLEDQVVSLREDTGELGIEQGRIHEVEVKLILGVLLLLEGYLCGKDLENPELHLHEDVPQHLQVIINVDQTSLTLGVYSPLVDY